MKILDLDYYQRKQIQPFLDDETGYSCAIGWIRLNGVRIANKDYSIDKENTLLDHVRMLSRTNDIPL